MKYLLRNSGGEYTFDDYFNYLDSVKEKFPVNMYKFASDWEKYSLESKSSLHDSWIEQIIIEEIGSGARKEKRNINLSITLLGPYHDRKFVLKYLSIEEYSLVGLNLRNALKGHGDILVHEFRLASNESFEHEILFESNGSIVIRFRDFIFEEKLL